MKIRLGFVSNSSSMNFYCEVCGNEYDIEARGGGPTTEEEWLADFGVPMPTEGICEDCFGSWDGDEGHMICDTCHAPHFKKDMIKVSDDKKEVISDYLAQWTDRRCINCLANKGEIDTIASEIDMPADVLIDKIIKSDAYFNLVQKLDDPSYEPTEQERKLIELVSQEPAPKQELKPQPESQSEAITIGKIANMKGAKRRLAERIIQQNLGDIMLRDIWTDGNLCHIVFLHNGGWGNVQLHPSTTPERAYDEIKKMAAGTAESVLRIYSLLDEDI